MKPVLLRICLACTTLSVASTAVAQEYGCSATYFSNAKELCGETGSNHCGEISGVLKNPSKKSSLTVAAMTANNTVLYVFDVPATAGQEMVIFKKKVPTSLMMSREQDEKKVAKCLAQ